MSWLHSRHETHGVTLSSSWNIRCTSCRPDLSQESSFDKSRETNARSAIAHSRTSSATAADVILPSVETACMILTSSSFISLGQAHTEETCVKNPLISILAGGKWCLASCDIATLIPVPQPSMSPISLNARATIGLRSTDIPVPRSVISSPSGRAPELVISMMSS